MCSEQHRFLKSYRNWRTQRYREKHCHSWFMFSKKKFVYCSFILACVYASMLAACCGEYYLPPLHLWLIDLRFFSGRFSRPALYIWPICCHIILLRFYCIWWNRNIYKKNKKQKRNNTAKLRKLNFSWNLYAGQLLTETCIWVLRPVCWCPRGWTTLPSLAHCVIYCRYLLG